MGYKLAEYAKELTPLQKNFLFYAVPKAMKRMNSSGGKNKNNDRDTLRQQVEQRRAAQQ